MKPNVPSPQPKINATESNTKTNTSANDLSFDFFQESNGSIPNKSDSEQNPVGNKLIISPPAEPDLNILGSMKMDRKPKQIVEEVADLWIEENIDMGHRQQRDTRPRNYSMPQKGLVQIIQGHGQLGDTNNAQGFGYMGRVPGQDGSNLPQNVAKQAAIKVHMSEPKLTLTSPKHEVLEIKHEGVPANFGTPQKNLMPARDHPLALSGGHDRPTDQIIIQRLRERNLKLRNQNKAMLSGQIDNLKPEQPHIQSERKVIKYTQGGVKDGYENEEKRKKRLRKLSASILEENRVYIKEMKRRNNSESKNIADDQADSTSDRSDDNLKVQRTINIDMTLSSKSQRDYLIKINTIGDLKVGKSSFVSIISGSQKSIKDRFQAKKGCDSSVKKKKKKKKMTRKYVLLGVYFGWGECADFSEKSGLYAYRGLVRDFGK